MSQFWLDDDDDMDNGDQGGGGSLMMIDSSLSSSQQQQQQQQQLLATCTNCGSTDFYYDAVAGRDVCQECFTQSQHLLTQEAAESSQPLDFEDIMELAAKTRGGTLVTSRGKKRKRTGGQQQQQQRTKQPLEELDQSVSLPDLETCLEGFTRVLQVCTRLLARRVGQQYNDHYVTTSTTTTTKTTGATTTSTTVLQQEERRKQLETSLLQTVQHLWVAYLCAFADGAEYYGRLCPEMRLSLRDAFCAYSGQHRTMILSHLTYRAEQEIRQQAEQEKQKEASDSSKKKKQNPAEDEATVAAAATETNNQDDSTQQNSASKVDATTAACTAAAAAATTTTATTATAAATTNPHPKATKKRSYKTKKKKTTKKKKASSSKRQQQQQRHQPRATTNIKTSYWNRVINASTRNRREGYKEAALKIKPSMEFISVLLWLAVCESGLVASSDLVQWIADGYFPLWNAMALLPATLQSKLRPIRTFFRLSAIPSPHYLETNGTILAVACRMKAHESQVRVPPMLLNTPATTTGITTATTHAHAPTQQNSHRVKQVVSSSSSSSTTTKTNEELVFWSTVCLPMVVTRLVANAGLGQAVLNRTLALMNLPVPTTTTTTTTKAQHETNKQRQLPKPLIIAQELSATTTRTTAFTRNEDILAIIGIACMMDPTWRSRPYRRAAKVPTSVPYNEVHFAMLDSGASLKEYLDFAEANVFDDKSKSWLWDGFDDLLHKTTQLQSKANRYQDDDNYGNGNDQESDSSSSPVVKPCPIIAGQKLLSEPLPPSSSSSYGSNRSKSKQEVAAMEWIGTSDVTEDVRRSMLIDFLAYSANAKVSRVREKMDMILSILRKDHN